MAFSETNRVAIREYLGFSAEFLQADPRLERAITVAQSVADGGTRPDNSTELRVLALIASLQLIDSQLDTQSTFLGAGTVDEVKVNSAREMVRLRMQGRMYVHRLARAFDTFPRSDVFSAAPQLESEYPAYPRTARQGY